MQNDPASPLPCSQPQAEEATESNPAAPPEYIVGIGASAGGLEALRTFFGGMKTGSGAGFVVIQHLAPDYKSLMVELLSRKTTLRVIRAEEGQPVMRDHVHLIPPGHNLTIRKGRLHLEPQPKTKTLNLPIDIFFRSLAQDAGERAIAVVLSGTGSDGARGIRSVKEAGGMVMVQAEASAKFAGMPSSAIATGTADFVLPVEEMPGQLLNFVRHPFAARPAAPAPRIPEDATVLDRICRRLREVTGIDFSLYKPGTLCRRIERRMNISQLEDIGEYLQYLQQSKTEAEALGKDLLISVTKFFRDPDAFADLEKYLEEIFAKAPPDRVVRLWSAGCATGEEAYSLALLCERARQRAGSRAAYKVFGTDVDRAALEVAAAGLYPSSLLADIPQRLQDKFFIREGSDHCRVSRQLRDRLIFARQDLISDPPFTRMDVAVCRNLLIYLKPAAQQRLLALLHFSLLPDGILFLGNSETLGELSYAFEPLASRSRIFRKRQAVVLRPPHDAPALAGPGGGFAGDLPAESSRALRRESEARHDAVRSWLLEKHCPATLVCGPDFDLLFTAGNASAYLRVPPGAPRLDALKMLPRELALAASSAGTRALKERQPVEYESVLCETPQGARRVRLRAEPFSTRPQDQPLLVLILKEEEPPAEHRTGTPFDYDKQLAERVALLEKELQATRDNLQAAIEQQETSNEELQAANEELLAANEELQSTNEELESVNEELYTVNAEYQSKIQELTEANDDMENFARSTEIGTLFLDKECRIRRFTSAFAAVTGLAPQDAGRNAATFGHPVMTAIASAVSKGHPAGTHEQILELRGQGEFLLRLQPYHQDHSGTEGWVAALVDISRVRDAERELKSILNTVDAGICVTDERGVFVDVNPAYCRIYGWQPEELIGKSFLVVVPPAHHAMAQRLHDDFIRDGREIPGEWDVVDKLGRPLRVAVRASLLTLSDGRRRKITVVSEIPPAQS